LARLSIKLFSECWKETTELQILFSLLAGWGYSRPRLSTT
jgi:hypothetical protein